MSYRTLPRPASWILADDIGLLVAAAFSSNLSVVASRNNMMKAVNRLRRGPPFTRTDRFPATGEYFVLEGEWFTQILRLTELLTHRDRAANINAQAVDAMRADNNSHALFATIEDIHSLHVRRHGYYNRARFDEEFEWHEPSPAGRELATVNPVGNLGPNSGPNVSLGNVDETVAAIAAAMNAYRRTQEREQPRTPPAYNTEELQLIADWSRPYAYTAVRNLVAEMKSAIIRNMTTNFAAGVTIPSEAVLRTRAMRELDAAYNFQVEEPVHAPATTANTTGATAENLTARSHTAPASTSHDHHVNFVVTPAPVLTDETALSGKLASIALGVDDVELEKHMRNRYPEVLHKMFDDIMRTYPTAENPLFVTKDGTIAAPHGTKLAFLEAVAETVGSKQKMPPDAKSTAAASQSSDGPSSGTSPPASRGAEGLDPTAKPFANNGPKSKDKPSK